MRALICSQVGSFKELNREFFIVEWRQGFAFSSYKSITILKLVLFWFSVPYRVGCNVNTCEIPF